MHSSSTPSMSTLPQQGAAEQAAVTGPRVAATGVSRTDAQGVVRIPLTKGYTAIVDACDAHLAAFKWYALIDRRADGSVRTVYAMRNVRHNDGRRAHEMLHRAVLGAPRGLRADHIDGDGLNCRRHNLRPATDANNQANRKISRNNTSGFKGVRWERGAWRAQIQVSRRVRFLGYFSDPTAAARAYDAAARKHFGEFACLNFPEAA